jgi:hypothetical protein
MYSLFLTLHNLNRWLVLLTGACAIIMCITGIVRKKGFSKSDNMVHAAFVGVCHLQLVLGLLLYFVSPFVNQAFKIGIGNAMKDHDLRFFAIEHVLVMFTGIVLIQTGRSLSKKQTGAMAKHKKALVFFSIGMLLILSRIPWQRVLWPL